jgi:hypothetical protein
MSYWHMAGKPRIDQEYAEQISRWENEGGALRHRPERIHDANGVAATGTDMTKGAAVLATSPRKPLSQRASKAALVSHGR